MLRIGRGRGQLRPRRAFLNAVMMLTLAGFGPIRTVGYLSPTRGCYLEG